MAALPPAGVDLQAKGFSDYIRKLNAIEKKNREVFDTEFKGTAKTFAEVTKAAKDYEKQLKKTADAEKKVAQEAKNLAAAQKTAAAAQRAANIATGNAALAIAQQVLQAGKAVFELGKLGAQFEAQQKGLENLAGSFGQSGRDIQKAITQASKGTISDLNALNVANTALLLGVAQTPKEFERLTTVAVGLGRALGLGAEQAIERFTTGLGRQSKLIIDDLGISTSALDAEIEKIAQRDFGRLNRDLSQVEKASTFTTAALSLGEQKLEALGDNATSAAESFDRMSTASENLKTQLGLAVSDLNKAIGATEGIAGIINSITEDIKIFRTVELGGGNLEEQIEGVELSIGRIATELEKSEAAIEKGGFGGFVEGFRVDALRKNLADLEQQLKQLNIDKVTQDAKNFAGVMDDIPPVVEDNTEAIKAYTQAIKQAEQLQLSFGRAAEDSALKLLRANEDLAKKQARANEDVGRKQAKSIAKLAERQKKDRTKLLQDQQKQLDNFEKNRRKQLAKAENDVRKERREASEQRKRDQRKLQNDLQRELDRFNLSRLQSERRFSLSESRLRAEGDILGLKELREDFALSQQEEKENFGLSKKEQVKSAKEGQKEQKKDSENRIKELQDNLDDQRAELLTSFDEQLKNQQKAQAEAVTQQKLGFQEAAAERAIALARQEDDRAIALAREEEDRKISQARQLEDLGISLANQKDITAEGVTAIAGEIEKVFGMEGVADNIITGFTERTESDFKTLFSDLESIIKGAEIPLEKASEELPLFLPGFDEPRDIVEPERLFLPGFDEPRSFEEGGIVPGPVGSSQLVRAHAGETILPTHQDTKKGQFFRQIVQEASQGQSEFRMAAPVIPSQSLEVVMSGNVNITGDGQANEAILQAAATEMTENLRIAVKRLARRN